MPSDTLNAPKPASRGKATATATPRATAVDIWYWPLDVASAGLDDTVISADERVRADRLHSAVHRSAFIAARTGLRTVLASYAGATPDALVFATGAHGKPALDGSDVGRTSALHFNLSHAGGFAALAVCRTHPVGIDIEQPRLVSRNLPQRFFSPDEAIELDRLADGPAWEDAFFRIWTRKEAVLKALGTGLSLDTRTFTVSIGNTAPLTVSGIEPEASDDRLWQLMSLEPPGPTHVAALAVRSIDQPAVTYRQWRHRATAGAPV